MPHEPQKGDIYKRSKPYQNYSPYYRFIRFIGTRSQMFPGSIQMYILVNIGSGPTASPTNLDDFTFQPQSEFPELYI